MTAVKPRSNIINVCSVNVIENSISSMKIFQTVNFEKHMLNGATKELHEHYALVDG